MNILRKYAEAKDSIPNINLKLGTGKSIFKQIIMNGFNKSISRNNN
jgi:hypothetical protein